MNDLAAVSLTDPVKVYVNENTDVALNLRQEFVRIRPNREGDREAIIAGKVLNFKTELKFLDKILCTLTKCIKQEVRADLFEWETLVTVGNKKLTYVKGITRLSSKFVSL